MVEYHNGLYFIVDMGSTNGVEFNGQRIARKQIGEGDVFRICDHDLSVHLPLTVAERGPFPQHPPPRSGTTARWGFSVAIGAGALGSMYGARGSRASAAAR